jgi:putative Mg2+ transporter-C (MgtC) family protein
MSGWLTGYEGVFAIKLGLCLALATMIGVEREMRDKPAGISTHCFVMAGACLFTFISTVADPNSPARIAAQVVSGVGFLGAGMILKSDNNTVRNLTTAAAIWFAAAIGMAKFPATRGTRLPWLRAAPRRFVPDQGVGVAVVLSSRIPPSAAIPPKLGRQWSGSRMIPIC